MSLVICPECGREKVSDKAEACPVCGFALKEFFSKNISTTPSLTIEEEVETQAESVQMQYDDSMNPSESNSSIEKSIVEGVKNDMETEIKSQEDNTISEGFNDVEPILTNDIVISNPMFSYSREEVRKMTEGDLINVLKIVNNCFLELRKIWDEKIDIEEKITSLENNRKKIINKMPAGYWVYIWIMTILCTFICTGIFPLLILGAPLYYFLCYMSGRTFFDWFSKEEKRIAKYNAMLEPLLAEMEKVKEKEAKYMSRADFIWSVNILGGDLFYSGASITILNILETGRAENYKEALKVYDEIIHRNYMEKTQDEIKIEAQKASSNAQIAAVASTVSAVGSYAAYKNSKKAYKNSKK